MLELEILEERHTPAPVALDAAGLLQLQAGDLGGTFFVQRFDGKDFVRYDLGDGLGLRTQIFAGGSIRAVTFLGGASTDLFWCQIAGLTCDINGGAGTDLLFGSLGGRNTFNLDGQDYIAANRGDIFFGAPLGVFWYN